VLLLRESLPKASGFLIVGPVFTGLAYVMSHDFGYSRPLSASLQAKTGLDPSDGGKLCSSLDSPLIDWSALLCDVAAPMGSR